MGSVVGSQWCTCTFADIVISNQEGYGSRRSGDQELEWKIIKNLEKIIDPKTQNQIMSRTLPTQIFTPSTDANLNKYIRPAMSNIRRPSATDIVYNDECVISFDSPFSLTGIYVNLKTFLSYGLDSLKYDTDAASTSAATPTLYAWILKTKVPRIPENGATSLEENPTKMAIGVDGGFKMDDQKYEILTTVHVVSILGEEERVTFEYPGSNNELPTFVSDVVAAVASHVSSAVATTESTWEEVCVFFFLTFYFSTFYFSSFFFLLSLLSFRYCSLLLISLVISLLFPLLLVFLFSSCFLLVLLGPPLCIPSATGH